MLTKNASFSKTVSLHDTGHMWTIILIKQSLHYSLDGPARTLSWNVLIAHCMWPGCLVIYQDGQTRLTTGWMFVYMIQPVVTTVLNEQHCSFNRLSNRVVQPVCQPAVYTTQPFVKPVIKRVWQSVECLYTRYNRLSNQIDNWLYRVYKHLPGCQTGLTTGCIV